MNIFALVSNPSVYGGKDNRIAFFNEGEVEGTCACCKTQLKYDDQFLKRMNETLVSLACSDKCVRELGWYSKTADLPPTLPDTVQKTRALSSLADATEKGVADILAGRVVTLQDGQSLESLESPKKAALCPECSGIKKGRGYAHVNGCSLDKRASTRVRPEKPNCPVCNGPAVGRGFSHAEGCSNIKVKSDKPKETCPSCGGIKRGRGFSHTDQCHIPKGLEAVALKDAGN